MLHDGDCCGHAKEYSPAPPSVLRAGGRWAATEPKLRTHETYTRTCKDVLNSLGCHPGYKPLGVADVGVGVVVVGVADVVAVCYFKKPGTMMATRSPGHMIS